MWCGSIHVRHFFIQVNNVVVDHFGDAGLELHVVI